MRHYYLDKLVSLSRTISWVCLNKVPQPAQWTIDPNKVMPLNYYTLHGKYFNFHSPCNFVRYSKKVLFLGHGIQDIELGTFWDEILTNWSLGKWGGFLSQYGTNSYVHETWKHVLSQKFVSCFTSEESSEFIWLWNYQQKIRSDLFSVTHQTLS